MTELLKGVKNRSIDMMRAVALLREVDKKDTYYRQDLRIKWVLTFEISWLRIFFKGVRLYLK